MTHALTVLSTAAKLSKMTATMGFMRTCMLAHFCSLLVHDVSGCVCSSHLQHTPPKRYFCQVKVSGQQGYGGQTMDVEKLASLDFKPDYPCGHLWRWPAGRKLQSTWWKKKTSPSLIRRRKACQEKRLLSSVLQFFSSPVFCLMWETVKSEFVQDNACMRENSLLG